MRSTPYARVNATGPANRAGKWCTAVSSRPTKASVAHLKEYGIAIVTSFAATINTSAI